MLQISGGVACADSRLKKDDRILEINSQELLYGTQEQAAAIIQVTSDNTGHYYINPLNTGPEYIRFLHFLSAQ